MVDVAALRALATVAEAGTLARASVELGYTPSALSQQIKRLERQVGVPLLAPAGRGVVLTAAARALVDHSGTVFAALEESVAAARSVAGARPTGRLRVAGFSTAVRGLLAPRLADLARRHADLVVEVTELDPDPAVRAVEVGVADLALLHDADGLLPALPATLASTVVHVDVGDLLVRADHPLAARPEPVPTPALRGATWVTSPVGTVCHHWFRRLVADLDPEPEVRHRVDDFSTQVALVAATGVVALLPRLARPPLPDGVVVRTLRAEPTRTVHAVWRTSAADHPGVRALRTALGARHTGSTGP